MKIILFLSLVVLCTSTNYTCLDSSMIGDEKICLYEAEYTNYYRPCPAGEICLGKVEGNNSLSSCQTLPIPKIHGESCNTNSDCITKNCIKNKCTGKEDGQSCDEDYECGKQSFCLRNNKTCTRYANKNENCSDDLKCSFGYECVGTEDGAMKCIEQFSVKVGGKAEATKLCESKVGGNGTCYDTRMKDGIEFKECTKKSDCVIEVIDEKGNVIREDTNNCNTIGRHGFHCFPPTTSKQWKNYVKAFKEVRDNINENKFHQSILLQDNLITSFSPVLRKANLGLYFYNVEDCVINTVSVLVGSGFINKVSFTLIALLFTIIA